MDASESVILENDLDESPKAPKRKLDDKVKSAPPKKVILKRHTSIELSKKTVEKISENDQVKLMEDKKIIKLSSLSAKEVMKYFIIVNLSFSISFLEIRNESKEVWCNSIKF